MPSLQEHKLFKKPVSSIYINEWNNLNAEGMLAKSIEFFKKDDCNLK